MLDIPAIQSQVSGVMQLRTKYVHLRYPVTLNERIDGWRVCWIGGWDRQRVFFVAMLVQVIDQSTTPVEALRHS